MIKKIIIGVLFTGLVGVLVFGGVNRTWALTQSSSSQGEGIGIGNGNGNNGQNQMITLDTEAEVETPIHTEVASVNLTGVDSARQSEVETAAQGRGGVNNRGYGNRGGNRQTLDSTSVDALTMALDDEYKALATYDTVINTFGQVAPFAQIAQAEQNHIDALVAKFDKYGLEVPENPWYDQVPVFDSLEAACAASAQAVIDNADHYEQFFLMTDNADLIQVFTNLSRASLESHLLEFQACK